MKVWRPKRKKSETDDLIAQADAVRRPIEEDVRRIRISRVRMAAAVPPVVALSLVGLFPFLIAEPTTVPAGPGISTPGPGAQQDPGPGPGTHTPDTPDPHTPTQPPPVGPGTPDPGPGTPTPPREDLDPSGRALLDPSLRYEQRTSAADQLARSQDPRALETLLQAALARDSATRALAARGLPRKLPDPRAATALRQLLEDPAPVVAEEASSALGKVGQARELLVGRLSLSDAPGQVHLNCIRGLIYQGQAEDVPLLMRWVRDEGPLGEAATEAVWAICQRTGAPPPPGLPKRLR